MPRVLKTVKRIITEINQLSQEDWGKIHEYYQMTKDEMDPRDEYLRHMVIIFMWLLDTDTMLSPDAKVLSDDVMGLH